MVYDKTEINSLLKDINKKKEIELPEIGTKFMVNEQEYKVIFINKGKRRFTCEPCKGLY